MENQELNNEKSLAIISEMIANTRNNVSQDGFYFLLWGFILVSCCLVQYIMIYFFNKPEESNLVWLIMPIIGGIASTVYGKNRAATRKVKTFGDEYYKYIWVAFGISLFCTLVLLNFYHQAPTFAIMIITGFAVFMSGIVLNFKPLIWGSFVFWLGSLCAIFKPTDASILLVFAICLIMGYIVPGFLLRKQYKNSVDHV